MDAVEPLLDLLWRSQTGLKGGDAVLNALVVNGRNGCRILPPGWLVAVASLSSSRSSPRQSIRRLF